MRYERPCTGFGVKAAVAVGGPFLASIVRGPSLHVQGLSLPD